MPTRSDPQPRPAHLNRPWDLDTKTFSPRSDALGLQFSEQGNELPPATRGSGLELGWGGMKSGWCPGSPPCPRTALPNRAQPRNLENLRIAEWRAWRISTLHSFPHHPCQPWGSRARIVKRLGRWLGISSDLPRSSVRLTRGGEVRRVALDGKGRQNEWSWPRQASKPPGRPRGIENAYRGSSKRVSNVSGSSRWAVFYTHVHSHRYVFCNGGTVTGVRLSETSNSVSPVYESLCTRAGGGSSCRCGVMSASSLVPSHESSEWRVSK
jgi:hypothetical protein